MVGGVSDGGFGTGSFADEILSDDVVDFDPHPAWDGGDEITAALPDGAHAATTTVAATGAKRKRKYSPTKAELRKRQRDDRRGLRVVDRAPGGAGAQMGGSGGSRV